MFKVGDRVLFADYPGSTSYKKGFIKEYRPDLNIGEVYTIKWDVFTESRTTLRQVCDLKYDNEDLIKSYFGLN